MVVAVRFVAATGIFFGFYPVRKAAQLDRLGRDGFVVDDPGVSFGNSWVGTAPKG